MWDNGRATKGISIFDVTSSLRNEGESVCIEHADDSAEPSRLGMDQVLPDLCLFDKREVFCRSIFKV